MMSNMSDFIIWLQESFPEWEPGDAVTDEMFTKYMETLIDEEIED